MSASLLAIDDLNKCDKLLYYRAIIFGTLNKSIVWKPSKMRYLPSWILETLQITFFLSGVYIEHLDNYYSPFQPFSFFLEPLNFVCRPKILEQTSPSSFLNTNLLPWVWRRWWLFQPTNGLRVYLYRVDEVLIDAIPPLKFVGSLIYQRQGPVISSFLLDFIPWSQGQDQNYHKSEINSKN